MSFAEFLEASGESRMLDILRSQDPALINALAARFTELLKIYMYVGGMPAAVKAHIETNDPQKVRLEQNTILNNYKNDFANHIPAKDLPKVRMIWDSIPYHLAKEKKKFVYKEIKTGGRAAEFENAMDWLVNTALVYRVDRTTNPKLPLSSYGDPSAERASASEGPPPVREHFKLYFLDVGLLGAKAMLDISTLMLPNNSVFTEFKGALTEQYALQELKANTALPVFYWGNDSGKAEVNFIMQYKNEIVPIEAKSAISTKSQSLSVYLEKYKSARAIRASLKPFCKDGRTYAVPLYMIGEIERVLADGGSLL
jgi:predicted AAA+ superfamily ATPase